MFTSVSASFPGQAERLARGGARRAAMRRLALPAAGAATRRLLAPLHSGRCVRAAVRPVAEPVRRMALGEMLATC
ncbi:hypothetical protein GCM10023334_115870 [Nonomuraea thailandensis]